MESKAGQGDEDEIEITEGVISFGIGFGTFVMPLMDDGRGTQC